MSVPKPFESALREFDQVARSLHIRYALIGGIAVILQGHQRGTRDVDVTVWDIDDRLASFVQALKSHGFAPRRDDWFNFAIQYRLLMLSSREGIDVYVALGMLP